MQWSFNKSQIKEKIVSRHKAEYPNALTLRHQQLCADWHFPVPTNELVSSYEIGTPKCISTVQTIRKLKKEQGRIPYVFQLAFKFNIPLWCVATVWINVFVLMDFVQFHESINPQSSNPFQLSDLLSHMYVWSSS